MMIKRILNELEKRVKNINEILNEMKNNKEIKGPINEMRNISLDGTKRSQEEAEE